MVTKYLEFAKLLKGLAQTDLAVVLAAAVSPSCPLLRSEDTRSESLPGQHQHWPAGEVKLLRCLLLLQHQ